MYLWVGRVNEIITKLGTIPDIKTFCKESDDLDDFKSTNRTDIPIEKPIVWIPRKILTRNGNPPPKRGFISIPIISQFTFPMKNWIVKQPFAPFIKFSLYLSML